MSCNNLVVPMLWGLTAWRPLRFVGFCIAAAAQAGGRGLPLFSAQHDFNQSQASGDEARDYTRGAPAGTGVPNPPPWLDWFTVSIGHHHIHHLSARMLSCCLADCQRRLALRPT